MPPAPQDVATATGIVISVERFVERLYAPLAWEAMIQLGDPAIASRLVERVLHRAWQERDRFASFDALYRHAHDIAMAAITREAERRLDVTRFDDGDASPPPPGNLAVMSADAVRRRLASGQRPPQTPPESRPTEPVAPPVGVSPSPHTASAPPVASPAVPMMPPPRAESRRRTPPRIGIPSARKTPAAPSTPSVLAAPRATRPSAFARTFSAPDGVFSRRRVQIIAGVALVTILLTVVALFAFPPPAEESALNALRDTTGLSASTRHGQFSNASLADGSTARLGADAALRASKTFAKGPRALHIAGPVSLSLKTNPTAPVAILAGVHRLLTSGAVVSFDANAAGVFMAVDSGSLAVVTKSGRTLVAAGTAVALSDSGTASALNARERDAVFAWRSGRLRLRGTSLRTIASASRQWYDLDVRFPAERPSSDTASIDAPLGFPDSLVAALEGITQGKAERSSGRVMLRASERRAAPPAGSRGSTRPSLVTPKITLPVIVPPKIPPLE